MVLLVGILFWGGGMFFWMGVECLFFHVVGDLFLLRLIGL